MAVRLDPWQNIVGVGWSEDAPPPPPTLRPSVHGGNCVEASLTLPVELDFVWGATLGAPAIVGDMLLAHVSAGGVTTISPPAGWNQIFHTTFSPFYTQSAFYRFKQEGDPDLWTFTQSSDQGMAGCANSVRNAAASPITAQNTVNIPSGDFADSLPLFIAPELPLILGFVDTTNKFFLQQNYPEPPNPPWFKRYRFRSNGTFDHGMMLFNAHSSVFSGPGTLPATRFSKFASSSSEIVTIVAIAPA